MNKSYQVLNYALTDVGNVRSNNEDAYGNMQLREGNLYIVCDGMGAHQAGEQASSMCVNLIKEFFSTQASGNPAIDIYNAIIFANEQIYVAAQVNDHLKGMGTTVVVLMVTHNEIHVGHVGDSRIYILTDGQLFQLTKDHSFVQGLVDQGLISKDEMERHSRKNELTNAIGIFQQVKPTISKSPIKAKANDKFLLCSDGLNGMISDEDIRNEMRKEQTIDSMCANLVSRAKIAGGHDNITVSCIEIIKSPFGVTNLEGVGLYGQLSAKGPKNLIQSPLFKLILGLGILVFSILGYLVYNDDLAIWPFSSTTEVETTAPKESDTAKGVIQKPDERDRKKEVKDNDKKVLNKAGGNSKTNNNAKPGAKNPTGQKNNVNNKASTIKKTDSTGLKKTVPPQAKKDTSSRTPKAVKKATQAVKNKNDSTSN